MAAAATSVRRSSQFGHCHGLNASAPRRSSVAQQGIGGGGGLGPCGPSIWPQSSSCSSQPPAPPRPPRKSSSSSNSSHPRPDMAERELPLLGDLLAVLLRVLEDHDLRLAMGIMYALETLPLASLPLGVSNDELKGIFRECRVEHGLFHDPSTSGPGPGCNAAQPENAGSNAGAESKPIANGETTGSLPVINFVSVMPAPATATTVSSAQAEDSDALVTDKQDSTHSSHSGKMTVTSVGSPLHEVLSNPMPTPKLLSPPPDTLAFGQQPSFASSRASKDETGSKAPADEDGARRSGGIRSWLSMNKRPSDRSSAPDQETLTKELLKQRAHGITLQKQNSSMSLNIMTRDAAIRAMMGEGRSTGVNFAAGRRRDSMEKQGFDIMDETWLAIPSHRFIVHPNGGFRMSWDCASIAAIFCESILIPLGVFFEMYVPDVILWISTFFFALDVVFNFLTGFFHEGVLVMKQQAISRDYGLGWFPLDAVATFPWHALFSDSTSNATILKFAKFGKIARVLRLLRIAKLNMLAAKIEDMFLGSGIAVVISILKILLLMGIVCHWCACFWGWLGSASRYLTESGEQPHHRGDCEPGGPCEGSISGSPWRRRYGLEGDPLRDQYLISMRFAIGLITGNESGIQPGFWAERLFAILAMFASFIFSAVIISQIILTFEKMYITQHEQQDTLKAFKAFMTAGQVPFVLQAKVKRYLEFQHRNNRDLQVRQFDLLNRLSPWLKKELQVHLNKPVLVQFSFFRDMPSMILDHACTLAAFIVCAPGDIVVEKDQNTEKMYFLISGKLRATFEDEECESRERYLHFLNETPKDDGFEATLSTGSRTLGKEPSSASRATTTSDRGIFMSPPAYVGGHNIFGTKCSAYFILSVTPSELLSIGRTDINDLVKEFPRLRLYLRACQDLFQKNHEDFQDCSAF